MAGIRKNLKKITKQNVFSCHLFISNVIAVLVFGIITWFFRGDKCHIKNLLDAKRSRVTSLLLKRKQVVIVIIMLFSFTPLLN